ncbi:MAG: signal peptidase I [Oscillospiraceae bacterium]|nr:signal peptidase I [Oscillospiraceae bacterium]
MKKCSSGYKFTSEDIREELKRINRKRFQIKTFTETVFSLVVVAAVCVLISVLFFPVFRVTGSSMQPTLNSREIVMCIKTGKLDTGDIAAFYYNNKVLLKRVIGMPGDKINIEKDGNVYVNEMILNESYISEKNIGRCDIDFPYEVPENRVFVMGDNRISSVDSRTSVIGCIADEYIIGKVFIRIWPFDDISSL